MLKFLNWLNVLFVCVLFNKKLLLIMLFLYMSFVMWESLKRNRRARLPSPTRKKIVWKQPPQTRRFMHQGWIPLNNALICSWTEYFPFLRGFVTFSSNDGCWCLDVCQAFYWCTYPTTAEESLKWGWHFLPQSHTTVGCGSLMLFTETNPQ